MPASDGGYCMRIRTIKTGTDATLPISDEALDLCGYRGQGAEAALSLVNIGDL